ncbi:branched-chain amino acid transport system permease protein [Microbacterium azadirachtae]|uniref:Branched-chain amino acid transport system permease protein n=1 Tax=Microbacterium azadirachtae TaxID=582680 RepID=A0A1I6HSH8_9MICO|nr:ABC transporter permease [Microbacterium azadirachtae]SFR57357.1 branched-chain amino acid transport system permease protein [Microbacterium azadirachtae]
MLDTLIAGLLRGNVYALGAVGISLVFGVMNVVNFAQFSFFGLGAMLAWFFVAQLHQPFWIALPLVLAICAVLGLVINIAVVRPLAKYLPLAAMLSTYAVAQILDNGSQLAFSAQFRSFPQVLPTSNLHIGNMRFGTSDLVMLGVTAVVMVAMSLFLKYGRTGRAIRATAQDQEAALQMGIPVGSVQNLSFVIASALGGLAGIFFSLYIGVVNPVSGLNIGMTAFVAAALGGLGSLVGAVVGGFVLGILEAFGIYWLGDAARQIIVFVVLLVVLIVRPGGLLGKVPLISTEPLTGTFLGKGRPLRIPRWAWIAAFVVLGVLVPVLADTYVLTTGTQVLIYAIIAAGFTVTAGQAGVLALGQAGPIAIGAYLSALLSVHLHLSFWIALPIAGLGAAVIASVLASPIWGVKGHYISIATLGLGIAIVAVIQLLVPQGVYGIPVPQIAGVDLNTPLAYYLIDFVVLVLTLLVMWRIRRSHLGKVISSVGSDEVAALASGVRVRDYKALAFAISAFFAGIGGSLLAHQYTYIDTTMFTMLMSLLVVTIVILGGVGLPYGAVVGSIVLIGAMELLRFTPEWRIIVYGLVLILVVRFRPGGVLVRNS